MLINKTVGKHTKVFFACDYNRGFTIMGKHFCSFCLSFHPSQTRRVEKAHLQLINGWKEKFTAPKKFQPVNRYRLRLIIH
jgi:hypothetical protein